jgi:hypothetical protein
MMHGSLLSGYFGGIPTHDRVIVIKYEYILISRIIGTTHPGVSRTKITFRIISGCLLCVGYRSPTPGACIPVGSIYNPFFPQWVPTFFPLSLIITHFNVWVISINKIIISFLCFSNSCYNYQIFFFVMPEKTNIKKFIKKGNRSGYLSNFK